MDGEGDLNHKLSEIEFLGICLDTKLQWGTHISNLSKKYLKVFAFYENVSHQRSYLLFITPYSSFTYHILSLFGVILPTPIECLVYDGRHWRSLQVWVLKMTVAGLIKTGFTNYIITVHSIKLLQKSGRKTLGYQHIDVWKVSNWTRVLDNKNVNVLSEISY